MSEEEKAETINPPSAVNVAAHPNESGGESGGESRTIDMTALEKAEKAIADMSDQYLDWVQDDLAKIDGACKALAASGGNSDNLERVFQIAHDMKGQGGSFGYDLITAIGNQLCHMIEKIDGNVGPAEIDAIGVHIDAMKLVIAQKMKGPGGEAGDQILDGLEKVMAKVVG